VLLPVSLIQFHARGDLMRQPDIKENVWNQPSFNYSNWRLLQMCKK